MNATLFRPLATATCTLLLAAPGLAGDTLEVDPALPEYEPVKGISGSIKSVGSDTLNNTMTLWAEGFKTMYPNVKIEIEGKGSSTAPPALIAGTANFGPMSREMKDKELDEFERRFGYQPTVLETAIDMLAVYVNKDNPLESLTLQQVDAIFSKTRKGGFDDNLRTWGDIGLGDHWARQPISLYGRNSASGTYGYFKKKALFGGDYKDDVKEQPGSSAVVQGIASDAFGMGYSGIGYKTADVRAIALALDGRSEAYAATPENAYTNRYPLSRFLYVYVNKKPNEELDPLRREFVRYVFSKQGQQDVIKSGYLPVPWRIAERNLQRLGVASATAAEASMKK